MPIHFQVTPTPIPSNPWSGLATGTPTPGTSLQTQQQAAFRTGLQGSGRQEPPSDDPRGPTDVRTVVDPATGLVTVFVPQWNALLGKFQWAYAGTRETATAGGGATWRPGELELEQQQQQLNTIDTYLNAVQVNQQQARDEWQRAQGEGNLDLARRAESRIAYYQDLEARLAQQRNAIELYGTRLRGMTDIAGVQASVAGEAAKFAANPFDAFSYLNLVNAARQGGSATPFAAGGTQQGLYEPYRAGLEGAFMNIFGNLGERLSQAYQMAQQEQAPSLNLPQSQNPLIGGLASAYGREPTPEEVDAAVRWIQGANSPPATGLVSAAGGGNFRVNEPVVAIGAISRQPLFTAAGGEQIRITPQKKEGQSRGGGGSAPRGFQAGGTVNVGTSQGAGSLQQRMNSARDQLFRQMASELGVDVSGYHRWGGPAGDLEEERRWAPVIAKVNRALSGTRNLPAAEQEAFLGRAGTSRAAFGSLAEEFKRLQAGIPAQAGTTGTAGGAGVTGGAADLSQRLSTALAGYGVPWSYTAGGPLAPAPSVIAPYLGRLQRQPSLYQLLLAAAAASGFRPEDYLAEAAQFVPTGQTFAPSFV